MKTFFCASINIPNIDDMLTEIRNHFLSKNIKLKTGFSSIDFKELQNCKIINDWIIKNNLEIRTVAVIDLPGNKSQDIHIDWNELRFDEYYNELSSYNESSSYAINFNIANCQNTFTHMYHRLNNLNKNLKFNINGYPLFSFKQDEVKLQTSYKLETIKILNVGIPHRVVNNTNKSRICLTIRFKNLDLESLPVTDLEFY